MPYTEDGVKFFYYGEEGAPVGAGKGAQVFEDIAKSARESGNKFVDPHFPPNDTILTGVDLSLPGGERVPITWLRPTEIAQRMFGTPPIFHGLYDQFAVNQGLVGNCWFLAVLADVALVPELVNTLVPPDNELTAFETGVYHFRFWCRGEWVDVCVDDSLPCIVKNDLTVVTLFSKPTETGGFWAPLLEKAYAKTYGSYGDINLGMPRIAMVEFTGGFTQTYEGSDPTMGEVLLAAKESHSLISLTTKNTAPPEYLVQRDPSQGPGPEPVTTTGMVLGHCYSILDVQRVFNIQDPAIVYTLLKVRNPWGNATEWNGDFSDTDPMSKLGEDVGATCNIVLEPKKKSYNPRDDIKGFLELSNDEIINFCGCKVVLEGIVSVKFSEGELNHSRTESIVKKFIFVGGDGRTKSTLLPPKTTYPFCIQLPYTIIPGSYKGTHGSIHYQILVYLSNGFRWIRGGEKEVKVNAVLELPRPSHPLMYEKNMPITLPEKNRRGPRLKFILRCDQGPIVYDGQDIVFTIHVENHNELGVKDIGVALIQYVTYKCGGNKVTKNVIAFARAPNPTAIFWKGNLSVPLKTRPSQTGLITIEYLVKVKMVTEYQPPSDVFFGDTPFTVCSKRIMNLNSLGKSGCGTAHTARTRPTILTSTLTSPSSPLSPLSPLSPQSPQDNNTCFTK